MLAERLTWREAKQLPRVSTQLSNYAIHDRISAGIAIDQCLNRPEFGKHEISKKKVLLANDDREVFFGKTIMGLYSISWVVHHFLEIPIIIDVSTQMHSNIDIKQFFPRDECQRCALL
jgi:hypothetical protein